MARHPSATSIGRAIAQAPLKKKKKKKTRIKKSIKLRRRLATESEIRERIKRSRAKGTVIEQATAKTKKLREELAVRAAKLAIKISKRIKLKKEKVKKKKNG